MLDDCLLTSVSLAACRVTRGPLAKRQNSKQELNQCRMMSKMSTKKRVLIVGAGAAGSAAAYSLGKHPDKFEVEIWEKEAVPGGVAVTDMIERDLFVNYGVQGGTPTYRNTHNLMKEFNFETSPVSMKISFGKGPTAWTNYTKTDLTTALKDDIKKFGEVLKTVYRFEAFFIFIPISKVLRWYGFSDDFCYEMVFPLTALFFGTGNQTPTVSAAIVARVFLDEDLQLFDYDSEHLLSQTPDMFAFPNLQKMYSTIIEKCGVKFSANRPVTTVRRTRKHVYVTDCYSHEQVFDDIIFACDAESVLKVLDEPSYLERKALGNVKYYNDLIITHEDEEYMKKFYELHVETDQYFVRTIHDDQSKIEMSFNLSNYQPQLMKSNKNIYQTIFLDEEIANLWSRDEINQDKILWNHWWRQFSHSWRHFAFSIPFLRFIQGQQHTWYCGSYTLINTHEIAVISGLAAAHRLGAPYPFSEDPQAAKQFDQYMMVVHGQPRTKGCNMDTVFNYLMMPFMILFAGFALLLKLLLNMFS